MDRWKCLLELDEQCSPVNGSSQALAHAIRNGADLRVRTAFDYEEHMGPTDEHQGLVEESIDFRLTYLINDSWTAGITTTRYPADSCLKFQPYPSLSFFLYNHDGCQAVARPFLQGAGASTAENPEDRTGQIAPRYFVNSIQDSDTPSPSQNFVYSFEYFRYCVCDDWTEVLSHDENGNVLAGSYQDLGDAFRSGCALKVGVRDLCQELDLAGDQSPHEVFIEVGSIYNHADRGFLGAESLPVVRVAPATPLQYATGNWNFGWIMPRTDGTVFQQIIDPYTRQFSQVVTRNPVRWFAR